VRRRAQDDGSARLAIPADIAAGPEVRLWAHPEALAALDRMESWPSDKAPREARADAIWSCMLSARQCPMGRVTHLVMDRFDGRGAG